MRRGRKAGIALLVVFVLLVGLVIVADRVGASVAESKIADQAAAELKRAGATSAARPEVSIGGFPFLTQVVAGTYDKITITTTQVQNGGIKLDTLTLVATDVKAAMADLLNGRGPVVAKQVTGTATMSWDTVKALIQLSGLPVPFDPAQLQIKVVDNRVQLRLPLTLAGYTTTLTAAGQVNIADGKIQLRLTDVGTEGAELPPAARTLLNQYRNRLTATIRTPQMPYRLVINKIDSNQDGVQVAATSGDVKLA